MPKRNTALLWCILAGVAAFRSWHLGALPIFLDEAGHIDHALQVIAPSRLTFWQLFGEELVNGKFLHVLLYSISLRWLSDPVLGSRFVSVVAGVCTAACCYSIGRRLFGARVGLVAALFYGVCPFGFFYDRMALADPILTAAGALTLAAAVALCRAPSWSAAAALALGMGLAPLAKVTGAAIWAVPPIACLFLAGTVWPPPKLRTPLLAAYAAAFAMVAAIYVPAYYLCPQKPVSGVLYLTVAAEPRHGVLNSLAALRDRLLAAGGWLSIYIGAPFLAALFAAPCFETERRGRVAFLLTVAAVLIVVPAAATSILFSRHVMWSAGPIVTVAAVAAVAAADRVAAWLGPDPRRRAAAGAAFLALSSAPAILWDRIALFAPAAAVLPAADRAQYIEAWPSGYGVVEAAPYLAAQAAEYLKAAEAGYLEVANSYPEVNVVCPEYGSTTYFGLRVLLAGERRVLIRFTPLASEAQFAELRAWARGEPTYVVLDRPLSDPNAAIDLTRLGAIAYRVASYAKPGGRASVEVYRVRATPAN